MINRTQRLRTVYWPIALALCTVLVFQIAPTASANHSPEAFSATVIFPNTEELTCENNDDDIQDIIEQMADLGYGVATGHFEAYDCDNPDQSDVYIPFAECSTSALLVTHFDDGNTYTRIGSRDLIMWRGCTPPESNSFLFSINAFSAVRIRAQNDENVPTDTLQLQASLTDPLWVRDIKVDSNDSTASMAPFDRKTNIVFTADRQSYLDLETAYVNAEIDDEYALNLYAIPGDLFIFSESELDTPRDTLTLMIKGDKIKQYHPDAYNLKPEDGFTETYLDQNFPFYIFYRDTVEFADKFPVELRDTTPPRWQKDLAKSVKNPFKRLVREVISHYEDQGFSLVSDEPFRAQGAEIEGQSVFNAEHGIYCITAGEGCQFDNYADAYWWDQQSHQLGDDDVYAVVGLDHAKLGMAEGRSYLGIYQMENPDNGNELEEIGQWTGSELAWITVDDAIFIDDSELSDVAQLSFLAQLTRPINCGDEDDLTFICPDTDALAMERSFVFRGRTTLNPETGTRPDSKQLIPWRLLHFKK